MNHECSTGYHDEPHYSCYERHRCRCQGCRDEKAAQQRAYKRRRQNERAGPRPQPVQMRVMAGHKAVVVPEKAWGRIVAALARRGVTPDEWLEAVARQAERRVA